jgi:serine/threonine protein kinase
LQGGLFRIEFDGPIVVENLLKRLGRFVVKLALEIAMQVASGLAAVHKQKLVHREIKPSNIMVNLEDGGAVTAKIIDLRLGQGGQNPVELLKAMPAITGAIDARRRNTRQSLQNMATPASRAVTRKPRARLEIATGILADERYTALAN